MKHSYILSIDQSTQSTKAMLIDESGHFVMKRDVQHKQLINSKGFNPPWHPCCWLSVLLFAKICIRM